MKRLVVVALVASAGCLPVMHPARVAPGWSGAAFVAKERVENHQDSAKPQTFDDDTLLVAASAGYGHRFDDEMALYVGGVAGCEAYAWYDASCLPFAAVDTYLQLVGGPGQTDAGVGVELSNYPTIYLLAGQDLGPYLRVDAGMRAAIGFDSVASAHLVQDGAWRDATPQLMLTVLAFGGWKLGLYGEWSIYRRMRSPATDAHLGNDAHADLRITGGHMFGLVVRWGE